VSEKLKVLGEPFRKEAENLVESANRLHEFSAEELIRFDDAMGSFIENAYDTVDSVVRETLTESQLQLAREYNLVMPGVLERMLAQLSDDVPSIVTNFDAYEALDLSDEQREVLTKLQKTSQEEMQPLWSEVHVFLEDLFEKAKNAESPEDFDLSGIIAKVNGLKNKAAALAKKTKEQIEANLTPEQKERLSQIREEVPKRIAKIMEELEKKKSEPQDDSWKDAWKPGDPIPEHLQAPEPKRRFPFGL